MGNGGIGDIQTYALVDTIAAFKRAVANDDNYPHDSDMPMVHGYNVVMLGQDVVILDMPNSTLLGIAQGFLAADENLVLSVDIQGTLARYNSSTPDLLQNDSFWNNYFEKMSTFETYSGWRVAAAFGTRPAVWAVVGGYVSVLRNSSFSMMFDLYRLPCSVMWKVNSSSIVLMPSDCEMDSTRPIDVSMLPSVHGIKENVIADFLTHTLGPFRRGRRSSPWRHSMAAMTVAAMHQNRWRHVLRGDFIRRPNSTFVSEFRYKGVSEVISKSRHTIDAKPLLYIIFAIQPVLSTAMLLMNAYFSSTPITSGFGLTSILASGDKKSLSLLEGAGLSGKLKKQVHLNIGVTEDNVSARSETHLQGRVVSELSLDKKVKVTEPEFGKEYA
ncbi:hypothetical protein QQX98_000393 [Neonectria punicea]|uniref:Uncharacterized protein n=1 Tax=Neonectria punicea TaxID=979145 RepID=A0ABR1HUP7_9HYPO